MIKHKYEIKDKNVMITLSKEFKNNTGVQVSGIINVDKYAEYLEFKKRREILGWMFADNNIIVGMSNPLTSLLNSMKKHIEKLEADNERELNTEN